MKRLIPASVIFIILILICIIGNIFVLNKCTKFSEKVESCYDAYQNGDYYTSKEIASSLYGEWDTTQKKLAFFVNHAMLDDISKATARLASYKLDNPDTHFASECIDMQSVLHRMCDEQRIIPENFY